MKLRAARFLAENKSLLLFFGLMLVFRSAVADWMVVPTGSMNPTIVEGDRILVDKSVYGLRVPFTELRMTQGRDPQRGDVVIFPSPEDGMVLVKRVVGTPGDTIEMRDERLHVNGRAVDYTPTADYADAELPGPTRAQQHYYLSEDLDGRAHPIMVLPNRGAMRSFAPLVVPAASTSCSATAATTARTRATSVSCRARASSGGRSAWPIRSMRSVGICHARIGFSVRCSDFRPPLILWREV